MSGAVAGAVPSSLAIQLESLATRADDGAVAVKAETGLTTLQSWPAASAGVGTTDNTKHMTAHTAGAIALRIAEVLAAPTVRLLPIASVVFMRTAIVPYSMRWIDRTTHGKFEQQPCAVYFAIRE